VIPASAQVLSLPSSSLASPFDTRFLNMETLPTITRASSDPAPATKSVFASKTVAVNLLIALATAFPQVGGLVQNHPQETLLAITLLNLGLRAITKQKLSLFGSDA